jgi:preprotein translocase subunit SecF
VKNYNLDQIINLSINETLSRTVITAFTTLIANFVLIIFANEAIKSFSILMFFGVLIGSFSSIFLSAILLKIFDSKKVKRS